MKRVPKTIDTCWKYCVELWTDIKTAIQLGSEKSVEEMKYIWMELNDLDQEIYKGCFFCHWADTKGSGVIEPDYRGGCPDCPGTKVDPYFACQLVGKHWRDDPIEFADYIIKLNKKRLRRKNR